MRAAELFWMLGLTHETRRTLSDMVLEDATVAYRREEHDPFIVDAALFGDDYYYITFVGTQTRFTVDSRRLYDTFRAGDRATISYRTVTDEHLDYMPPDFDRKQVLKSEYGGKVFIDAVAPISSAHTTILNPS